MRKTHTNKINRIEYIVRENPNGVAALLQKEGYKLPKTIPSLIQMTKSWINHKGKAAIVELLKVHPERQAILTATGHQEFDNFGGCSCKSNFSGGCGCKSNYSGGCGCKSSFDGSCGCGCKSSFSGKSDKRDEIIEQLKGNTPSEVLAQYEELKELAHEYPDDEEIRYELEVTWDFMRKSIRKSRKKKEIQEKSQKPTHEKKSKAVLSLDVKDLAVGSFVMAIALLVAQIKS